MSFRYGHGRARLGNMCVAATVVVACVGSSASGNSNIIEIELVDSLASEARYIVTSEGGFDLDSDGYREFIVRLEPEPTLQTRIEFIECQAGAQFQIIHTLDGESPQASFVPADVTHADPDDLNDLLTFGRIQNDHYLRTYEAMLPDDYPTAISWETQGPNMGFADLVGGVVVDADLDGSPEFWTAGLLAGVDSLMSLENSGDDVYGFAYSSPSPGNMFVQSVASLPDLDGDGMPEVVLGGAPGGRPFTSLAIFESIGDDEFEITWDWLFSPAISVEFIVDAGDLDGDGKPEFLAGGLKPNFPLTVRLFVFEAVGDNDFERVALLSKPASLTGWSTAAVADLDGDGAKEIVLGTGPSVYVFESVGDNSFREIWSSNNSPFGVGPVQSIGAGDHDGDGKAELIFRINSPVQGIGIFEIDPIYAADFDSDGTVNAIDNCPLLPNADQSDIDGDTVGDLCDNCVFGPNPDQGDAPFGQTIIADAKSSFMWPMNADIVWATGEIGTVSSYTVLQSGALRGASSLSLTATPASTEGYFVLVRPDCSVGSWQNEPGSEPARDANLR